MFIRLTPRWHPLKTHDEQSRAWHHPARFKTVHAGRRSGKTELFGKRKRVLWLWDCRVNPRPWGNPRSFIAAPTRDQVKAIYWRDIKALIPRQWLAQPPSETELSIITKWNAELRLVGLDKPDRIEGQPWDAGTIDEYASCKAGIFDGNIRPAIADRQGGVDLIGVPDFQGPAQAEYQEFCDRGQSGDPEWCDFAWGSDGILPKGEVESMRRTMDPRLFEQETTGRFILPGGRAFPDFDPAIHAKTPCPYDPALPLCWSLDFNINPMCSGVIQHHKGHVRVIDELVLPDTRTERAVDAFLERCKARGWSTDGLSIYGDASGSARDSTSGTSDWQIVRNMLRDTGVRLKVPAANPPIKDTVNAVNGRLKSADSTVSMSIDPACRTLIKDLKSALAGDDFGEQHCLAWLRYFTHWEYPVRSNSTPGETRAGVVN